MKPSSELDDSLQAVLGTVASPAVLHLDERARLVESRGNLGAFGLGNLHLGDDVTEHLPVLATGDLGQEAHFPFLTIAAGHVAHVHLRPIKGGAHVVLLGATVEHDQQLELQQAKHHLQLAALRREQLLEELARANAAKSRFIAGMSHEFRTPLAAVIGYADLLSEDHAGGRGARAPKLIQGVYRSAQHLLSLIDNILEQARMDAGEVVLRPRPVSFSELIDDLRALLSPIAFRKELEFEVSVSGSFPERIVLDPVRCRQVLVNLVGNAIKFTDEGQVMVYVIWDEETLEVIVRDTGPGISEHDQKEIFRPFRRAEEGKPGVGLGLPISKQLVEHMGGRLGFSSQPGEGTTFTISLPAPRAAVEAGSTPLQPEGGAVRGRRTFLLAEDNELVGEVTTLALTDTGLDVLRARDGEDAVSIAMREHPDVVLMDLHMPKLDGYGATRALREQGYEGPIIALSASSAEEDRRRALEVGCSAYLVKPVEVAELLSIVAKLGK